MIIDKICDAMDGDYNPRDFYNCVNDHEMGFPSNHPISRALDGGTNQDVQKALCSYVDVNEYNADIKKFINKFTWVED